MYGLTSPDYDRWLDYQQEARYAEQDSYEEWCAETGADPEADNTEAWEDYKRSCTEADMELSEAQERQERMEMGDEWYA